MEEWVNIRGVPHYCCLIHRSKRFGERPVMVFVHGWGGSARYWESTAQELSSDFDCLLYDLRGFGRSSLPTRLPKGDLGKTNTGKSNTGKPNPNLLPGYELGDYALDLLGLLEHYGLEKVYLNGHSLGASIVAAFLEKNPHRSKKVILTCNGIFQYNPITFKAFHQVGSWVVKLRYQWFLNVPFAGKLFMLRFLYQSLEEDINKAFLKDYLSADLEAALGTLYSSVSKKAAEEMPNIFAHISVPTLLISGEKDQIIPPKLAKDAIKLNGKIQYREIPKTGHFPMLEAPSVYFDTIKAFLRDSNP